MFSSKWSEELKVRSNVPSPQQLEEFTSYLYANAYKFEHVYLAGGEPLLMKQNLFSHFSSFLILSNNSLFGNK
jgi:organic radical activating enzyme